MNERIVSRGRSLFNFFVFGFDKGNCANIY